MHLVRYATVTALGVALLAGATGTPAADAPLEWSDPAPLADRALLLDGAESGGRVIVVGDHGHVLRSTDLRHWAQSRVPTRSMLTAVAAVGEDTWAVGHDAVILYSANGGATWSRQHAGEGDPPLLDVWFADARHGLAVGAYGLALATADGGARWDTVTIDDEERHLNAIAAAPDGAVWVAAENGAVFRSRDRGVAWEPVPTPYRGSLFGALALRDGAILVFGLRGNVYRSDDSRGGWARVETGTDATLLGGTQLADGSVLLVGLSGTVLVSRDGGRRFAAHNRADRLGLATLLPLAADRLLVLGESGAQVLTPAALEGRS